MLWVRNIEPCQYVQLGQCVQQKGARHLDEAKDKSWRWSEVGRVEDEAMWRTVQCKRKKDKIFRRWGRPKDRIYKKGRRIAWLKNKIKWNLTVK